MRELEKKISCGVVIVCYQSQKTLQQTLTHLDQQSRLADSVLVIDSASPDPTYLNKLNLPPHTQLVRLPTNVGFSAANNIGFEKLKEQCDYILFLNPDAFLTTTFLADALQWMEQPAHYQIGAITALLLGYDYVKNQPNGRYDSTGVFRRWYGNWYDRDQGKKLSLAYTQPETIPALCGALMFCRKDALASALNKNKQLFDESFFMYKEDIDLSLRLRRAGWTLSLVPALKAYHCRGWQTDRRTVPKHLRLCSAVNELRIHWRNRWIIPMLYSLTKYCAVKLLNR